MGNRSNTGSRALNVTRSLPAFVLSAILGIAFVAVVNKTHDMFASEDQTVLGTWQGTWYGLPSLKMNILREGSR